MSMMSSAVVCGDRVESCGQAYGVEVGIWAIRGEVMVGVVIRSQVNA